MKKLIILLVLLSSLPLFAQEKRSALYVSMQPADFGIGLRYDFYPGRIGIYNSITYGNLGLYKANQIKHHVKITAGILAPLPDYNGAKFDITAGINYHYLGSVIMEGSLVSSQIFNPWSFELGLTTKWKRLCIGVRTDLLRWEPTLDLGIKFKNYEKYNNSDR